ncbi:MAG TPA: hypothetical protein VM221_02245, partial [Armatimonadota bacterium]|nr:hypothetical protein [Armatimonadota bacterium]
MLFERPPRLLVGSQFAVSLLAPVGRFQAGEGTEKIAWRLVQAAQVPAHKLQGLTKGKGLTLGQV